MFDRVVLDVNHGLASSYNLGCRCVPCTRINTTRTAAARRARTAKIQAGDQPNQHGWSTYINWGCRCEVCTAANTEANRPYSQAYYQRRKDAVNGSVQRA